MRARSGVAADVAFVGSLAVGGVGVEGVGGLFDSGAGAGEDGEVALDVVANDLRSGGAGLAVVDGGFEELGPLEFAVALVEGPPGVEGSGDGDGDGSVGGEDAVLCAGAGDVESEGFGRAAGAGEADDFVEFGVPDHGEAVAADAGAGGFDEAEDGVGGNGGVDCGAAFFQGLDGGEGGERMRCACGSAASHGGRAAWRNWLRRCGRQRGRRGRSKVSAPAGWNLGRSFGVAPSVWLWAFEEPTEAIEPAAASGSAAMKERRRKVFS